MLFDRPEADDNAVLVHVELGRGPAPVDAEGRLRTDHLDEFAELARAAGARIVGTLEARREQPAPRYFVGTGKADELKALVSEREARLVIFDHDLSPAQERNLEAHLEARVLSQLGLILDIFANAPVLRRRKSLRSCMAARPFTASSDRERAVSVCAVRVKNSSNWISTCCRAESPGFANA